MSPELITAIRERIEQSQSKEEIRTQVLALGHSDGAFEAAYTAALHAVKESVIETGTVTQPTLTTRDLPRVMALVKESFSFTRRHLVLVGLLVAPLIVSYIATELSALYADDALFATVAGGVAVLSILVYLFNFSIVLYQVGKVKKGESGLKSAFAFARKHFLTLMGIYILSMFALWGGFVLFVIPAIIVYTTLYFAPFVFLHENKTGMDALLGSREIVKGRWWVVTLKIFKYGVVVFFPILLLSALYTTISEFSDWGTWGTLAGEMVLEVFMTFGAVMNLFAMNELYHALSLTKTHTTETTAKSRHWILVGIGGASLILAIGGLVYLFNSGELSELPIEDISTLEPLVYDAYEQAGVYYAERGTYEGVCAELTAQTSDLFDTHCNDEAEKWAFSVSNGIEIWCSDTATLAKLLQSPIGDRVECLNLPN